MNNLSLWLQVLIPCLYVGLAVISYLLDREIVLTLLGIPWSIPLMMFSGLIVHATVDGNVIISAGSMVGIVLNLCLYAFVLRRKGLMQ